MEHAFLRYKVKWSTRQTGCRLNGWTPGSLSGCQIYFKVAYWRHNWWTHAFPPIETNIGLTPCQCWSDVEPLSKNAPSRHRWRSAEYYLTNFFFGNSYLRIMLFTSQSLGGELYKELTTCEPLDHVLHKSHIVMCIVHFTCLLSCSLVSQKGTI